MAVVVTGTVKFFEVAELAMTEDVGFFSASEDTRRITDLSTNGELTALESTMMVVAVEESTVAAVITLRTLVASVSSRFSVFWSFCSNLANFFPHK